MAPVATRIPLLALRAWMEGVFPGKPEAQARESAPRHRAAYGSSNSSK